MNKQSGAIRPSSEPPKSGFIPRTQDQGISHRQAIRHTPSSPVANTQLLQPASKENCSPSLRSYMTTPSVTTSWSHAVYGTSVSCSRLHNNYCGSLPIPSKLRSDAPYSPAHVSSSLNQQVIEAQSEFDNCKVRSSKQSAIRTDSVSNMQFDFLRSEPQLIIS